MWFYCRHVKIWSSLNSKTRFRFKCLVKLAFRKFRLICRELSILSLYNILYILLFVFQAAKNSKPILLPVILMNGQRLLIEADTATTVNEICSQIAQRAGLKDRSGFSIYITLGPRVGCSVFKASSQYIDKSRVGFSFPFCFMFPKKMRISWL